MVEYVEAWLEGERFMTELVAIGRLDEDHVVGMAPREMRALDSGAEYASALAELAKNHEATTISLGIAMSKREVGKARPDLPNAYTLTTCSKDLASPMTVIWDVEVDDEANVRTWKRAPQPERCISAPYWSAVF